MIKSTGLIFLKHPSSKETNFNIINVFYNKEE